MNVQEIVIQYLRQNGFDGLYYPGECGCTIDDLAPCGEMTGHCEPGVKKPCTCGEDCEWDIGPKAADPAPRMVNCCGLGYLPATIEDAMEAAG